MTQLIGQLVKSQGPFCSVGELCEIVNADGKVFPGEIVGFRGTRFSPCPWRGRKESAMAMAVTGVRDRS